MMKRIDLMNIIAIRNKASSPLWDESTLVVTSTHTIVIPRPIMVGIGIFLLTSDATSNAEQILRYGEYEFVIPKGYTRHHSEGVISLWKYLTDARLTLLSKVCGHDYTRLESFMRAGNERLPVDVSGYQVKVLIKPGDKDRVVGELWVRQTLLRTDLKITFDHQDASAEVYQMVYSATKAK